MFITPAFAQASPLSGLLGGDSSGMITSFMPLILIIVIMYFLILRPQQRKAKLHQDMIKALRRGDSVVTNGGLVGKVTKVVDDDQIEVEIADGVRVRQMRSMVADVRSKGEPVKDDSAS
jgi:preprotein translocase subunit YajC